MGLLEPSPTHVGADGVINIDGNEVDAWQIRQRKALARKIPTNHGYSTCGSCDLPWWVVDGASVSMGGGRGMFAICLMCWNDIGDPEKILPFYKAVYDKWGYHAHDGGSWERLEMNIRNRNLGHDWSEAPEIYPTIVDQKSGKSL
jgi:hypothetical protein